MSIIVASSLTRISRCWDLGRTPMLLANHTARRDLPASEVRYLMARTTLARLEASHGPACRGPGGIYCVLFSEDETFASNQLGNQQVHVLKQCGFIGNVELTLLGRSMGTTGSHIFAKTCVEMSIGQCSTTMSVESAPPNATQHLRVPLHVDMCDSLSR